MKTILYRSTDEAEPFWRSFERRAECWPFQSFDFVSTWQRTIGQSMGTEPCIVAVHDADGTPLMLLPLALDRRGPFRVLSWLGGDMADYKGPLVARQLGENLDYAAFTRIWHEIAAILPSHDLVSFDSQPEFIGSEPNPFTMLSESPHPSSSHYTLLEGDVDSFLAAKRSSKSRWQMRRKYRRLQEMGEIEFVIPREQAEIESVMQSVFEQKSRNYRELGVPDLFAKPEYREFCLSLSRASIETGFAHLSALTLDGELVAGHWGLVFRKRFYFLFPSYAVGEVERLSPGVGLLQHLFKWCFDHGVEVFDFTVGDEPYKDLWCDRELALFHHVQATSLQGIAPAAYISTGGRLKRAIKTSDVLWPIASRARSVLANPGSLLRSNRQTRTK
jgi:CelD/BcsL family acetyltransferase involved in cellulose biosynthesis